MNREKLKEVTLFAGLLLLSTLLLQVVWPSAANGENRDGFTAEKVNLALRRTAHHLLSEAGDSTSLIPPVKQTGENEWFVQMENSLNYDRLPTLLQESFDVNGIHRNYDVAVLRCSDNELQLGYNLPKNWLKKVHFEKMKIYVTAQNLLTFTKYSGLDPEIGSIGGALELGIDRGFYPQARTVMGGVSLTF